MPPKPAIQSLPLSWRDCAFLTVQNAAAIAGVSPASLYRFAKEGRLELRRLGGRTVVETRSLVAILAAAEAWAPSGRARAAVESRSKRSARTWEE